MTDKAAKRVVRKPARSGRTSYTEPIRIGGNTHLEVLLQYIPHNSGPDTLSPKLTYWKRTAKGFRTGFPAEFTLSQDEAIRLRDVLDQGLKLTDAGSDGAFLLVPIGSDDEFDSSGHDPVEVAQALISVLHGGGVLAAATSDSAGAAAVSDLQSSIQLAQLNDAIVELEGMLTAMSLTKRAINRGAIGIVGLSEAPMSCGTTFARSPSGTKSMCS